ncbi:two-component system, cell cycle sensor histidine kinase PleC [Faunimonas pinastri]|uniref:histidine kinase n=1 Tax=Faunimonas pinastri TaxID=1855383 RepID=A0A1H9L0L7_9HYPH|nr:ATP-binding protein [Faunimonas pinastri]SER04563.1 two-component system, cell cycle sensor histidine kinase PleC [Faunimonas pinastri]
MALGRWAIASGVKNDHGLKRPERPALAGHARLFVHPAYQRLVVNEPFIKRFIPFLIILFVLALALMRVIALYDIRQDISDAGQAKLSLIAKSVATDLFDTDQIQTKSPEVMQGELETSAPPDAAKTGRLVLAVNSEEKIVAAVPPQPDLLNRYLDDWMGPGQPLTTLGERAGVLQLTLPSGEDVIATVYNGKNSAGSIAVVQPVSSLYSGWRRQVSRETIVFIATSIVLVILGFAFHAQAARAQEADSIYLETETRFHMALRRGRSGLWDWDLSRGAIFWSQSMFEILGLAPRDALLSIREVAQLVNPEDTDLIELANGLVRTGEGQVDREFRMRHADGHWVWVRARAEVVLDKQDDPHLVGIAVDVTEQKRMAEASRMADLRLRDAIEAISEAFVLWDASDRLVMCNSKYQQLYGLPDNLVRPGTAYEEIVSGGRRPIIANAFPASGSDVGARSLEARLDDGRWLQINERRTKDGGFVSVGTDITTLKENEKQLLENERALTDTVADLRHSRQQLEKQAQQLVDLAEKYAEEKNKAEDASRIKSEFLANVSHELRTPLNAIIGFSEMMLSGVFGDLGDEKYAEYCRDIRESGRFLLSIISDILDMARLESGRLDLAPEIIEVGNLVAEAVVSHADEAERGHVQIMTDVVPELVFQADRKAVRQILFNLVSNAIKFTPSGGAVKVSASRMKDGVCLMVEDTGIGIPQTAVAKLGRPFEQVQSQMTRNHKGSGLGLAIARSLAVLHGGYMEIASAEGVGTKISVFMPMRPQQPPKASAAA